MNELKWAIVTVLVVIAGYAAIAAYTKPVCPFGSYRTLTRSGWYCVVPSVRE